MSTLFYKGFTGLVNWTTYPPIDRRGAGNWAATLVMDSTSTGTMEFLIEACTDST